jgi:hypothetical protein
VIRELECLQAFAAMSDQIVVPDTSALVKGPIFDTFDWHSCGLELGEPVRVVVPILVVEELDRLKVGKRSSRVRSVLEKLWDLHAEMLADRRLCRRLVLAQRPSRCGSTSHGTLGLPGRGRGDHCPSVRFAMLTGG